MNQQDSQLVFLTVGQLREVDTFKLSANCRGQVNDTGRSPEQGPFVRVSASTCIGNFDVSERLPVEFWERGLEIRYKILKDYSNYRCDPLLPMAARYNRDKRYKPYTVHIHTNRLHRLWMEASRKGYMADLPAPVV